MYQQHIMGGTTMLPRDFGNELKMAVAVEGFSLMREGSGKKVSEQIIELEEFFHMYCVVCCV